jgi:hypothetical protein
MTDSKNDSDDSIKVQRNSTNAVENDAAGRMQKKQY